MFNPMVRKRTLEAVQTSVSEFHPTLAQHSDIAKIVDAAIDLEKALYSRVEYQDQLFRLRKALEGVFGHEYGDDDEPLVEVWSDEV